MPSGLPNIQPVGMGDWLRAVIHAYPGAGKTSLIGSGAESGYKTLIVRSSMDLIPSRVLKSGAEEYVADTWEHMNEILTFCQHAHPFPYDIVWWDNISVAQDMLLDDVWEATVAEKPARAFRHNPETGRFDKPNLSPTSGLDRGEYGRNMERIQQWLRHMVGCNTFHFGVMAHPHEGQHPTNDEGGFLLRPYVQGKMMTEKLCGYGNFIGFMEVMEEDKRTWRRLHVKESPRWYAKDQFDAFLPNGYLDEPTLPKIMTAIEKARGRPLGKNVTPLRRRGAARKIPATRTRGRRREQ
jgi:hypothetical protein